MHKFYATMISTIPETNQQRHVSFETRSEKTRKSKIPLGLYTIGDNAIVTS